jgi:hypothetical protein
MRNDGYALPRIPIITSDDRQSAYGFFSPPSLLPPGIPFVSAETLPTSIIIAISLRHMIERTSATARSGRATVHHAIGTVNCRIGLTFA